MIPKRHTNNSLTSLENLAKRSRSPARTTMKADTRQSSIERKSRLIKKKPNKDKDPLEKQNTLAISDKSARSLTKSVAVLSNDKAFTSGRLFDAVLDGNTSIVRHCLVVDGMNVNDYSPEGTTTLHLASAAGSIDVLELLINCGGFVDCTDVKGRTPLEYAVLYGNFDCATLLIENGADSKCIKNGFH